MSDKISDDAIASITIDSLAMILAHLSLQKDLLIQIACSGDQQQIEKNTAIYHENLKEKTDGFRSTFIATYGDND